MGQALIRNLPEENITKVKAQASQRRVSFEQRLRDIIDEAVKKDDLEARFQELSGRTREQTKNSKLDSTAIIREDRDR